MNKQCQGCGNDFEAKRSDKRYCSDACRLRRQRLGPITEGLDPVGSDLRTVIIADLTKADRLETVTGKLALALADAIGSPFTTGAAKASLSKELRSVMAGVVAGTESAHDPVDQLRRRRALKLAAVPNESA